jgi:pimeloyl-ACP methyl ester carboxylesterase
VTKYVLVHGAFGGGWIWRDVASFLRARDQEVFTPTLTGLGERVHLAHPEINLSTHIQDVVNVFDFEDITGAVLVGHSYAGMVITGVADRIPQLVSHIVYLDAHVPQAGQSHSDLMGIHRTGDEWLLPPPTLPEGSPSPTEVEQWMMSKLVSQPRRTLEEKLSLSDPIEKQPFSRTLIKAVGAPRASTGNFAALWRAADRVRNDPGWNYLEIDTGHMVQIEKPEQVAAMLLELH